MTSGYDATRTHRDCFELGCVGDGKGPGDLPGQSPLGADEKTKAQRGQVTHPALPSCSAAEFDLQVCPPVFWSKPYSSQLPALGSLVDE